MIEQTNAQFFKAWIYELIVISFKYIRLIRNLLIIFQFSWLIVKPRCHLPSAGYWIWKYTRCAHASYIIHLNYNCSSGYYNAGKIQYKRRWVKRVISNKCNFIFPTLCTTSVWCKIISRNVFTKACHSIKQKVK